MSIAEFAADLDGRKLSAEVVALAIGAGRLEVHLSTLSMIDLHIAELHGGRIVGFRETSGRELRSEDALGCSRIKLAIAGRKSAAETGGSRQGVLIIGP